MQLRNRLEKLERPYAKSGLQLIVLYDNGRTKEGLTEDEARDEFTRKYGKPGLAFIIRNAGPRDE